TVTYNPSLHDALPERVLLAMLEAKGGSAQPLLQQVGVNVTDLTTALRMAVDKLPTHTPFDGEVQASRAFGQLFNLADKETQQLGDAYITTEAMLLAACAVGGAVGKLMQQSRVNQAALQA